jgi:hypothetical protein
MADLPPPPTSPRPEAFVDNVLLIDGDNDPHLPSDFPISDRSLVRVFLRLGAKMPRTLERRLGDLPYCVTVVTTEPGANAADFVMSHHAGILHATLPMHLPFVLVTNDKALQAIAQELQRLGRQASLWTSHPERGVAQARRSRSESASSSSSSSDGRGRGGRGRRRGGRARAKPSARAESTTPAAWESAEPISLGKAEPEPAAEPASAVASVETTADPKLSQVASSYAARLARIKDPPSRLKTLINDIANRTKASGVPPEAIIEELKRSHGLAVDAQGRVTHGHRKSS